MNATRLLKKKTLTIHRWSLSGGFMCGGSQGKANMQGLGVTCQKCLELSKSPGHEEYMKRLIDTDNATAEGRDNDRHTT